MVLSLTDTPHSRMLPSQQEMRHFDEQTIASLGSAEVLMERAGLEIFRELKERYSFELYSNGRVVVLAGPGNNGGDGLVIARHLKDHGYEVAVVLASASKYSPELLRQLETFRRAEGSVLRFPDAATAIEGEPLPVATESDLETLLTGSSVVVDGLLGTGQVEAPRGAIASMLAVVQRVRDTGVDMPKIVAVDMPTGINGDTGEVYENALSADLTVAIELIKRGMVQFPARSICGDIWTVPIGLSCDRSMFSLLDKDELLPVKARRPESHKGDFGSVLVIGGSEDMPGAPMLSARSALRCGAGTVIKAHLRGTGLPGLIPELMLLNVGENDRCFAMDHREPLCRAIEKCMALVLGPGIGVDERTVELLRDLFIFAASVECPIVIDADGLNALAIMRERGESIECRNAVLTPHPGEMARLLGISGAEVQANRYRAALELSKITTSTVVLKGAATVIASGHRGWVSTSGNPWMAVAGSGDVLSGIIGAFMAQGFSAVEAAKIGVSFHGRAGDQLEQQGLVPFLAGDLGEMAARLIGEESQQA